jgi:soluble lytic murein transglycosylase-like protein
MRSAYRSIIEKWATAFGLDPRLVEAMVWIESSDNPWADRHEPEFEAWLRRRIPGLTSTQYKDRSTSWGLLQILGEVAYERGYREPYFTKLCQPDVGIEYGCRHLAWLLNQTSSAEVMVRAYNTGLGGIDSHDAMIYWTKVSTQCDILQQV